jgi:hypothetical protein
MVRRSESYWKKMMGELKASGLTATAFCKRRSLKRGTFLRWRKRLGGDRNEPKLIEIPNPKVSRVPRNENSGLEIRIGQDIRIGVYPSSDLEFVGKVVAAIRHGS